jgi:hypothetical protein
LKPTREDIGWLAGMMDGEGCITLTLGDDRPKGHMHLCVAIANTSVLAVKKIESILSDLNVSFKTYTSNTGNSDLKWKDIRQVKVMRIDDVRNLLETIEPYLTCKREQALLMLAFLRDRKCGKRIAYTERCQMLAKQIREANRRGTVTTARESQETVKIQSELTGDRKSAAEMSAPEVN